MARTDREAHAAEELSAFESRFLYADHRLFEKGQFAELARRLRKRARWTLACSVIWALVYGGLAAFYFVQYGAEGDLLHLVFGGVHLSSAVALPVIFEHWRVPMQSAAERVLQRLGVKEERGEASPPARPAMS
jgi:hypothetical protein